MVSGGTDNHLMLLDLVDLDVSGRQLEDWLGRARITVNKNMVPRDRRKPTETSGIRIGTPAVTTRGMVEKDMTRIAQAIARIIREGESAVAPVLKVVAELTEKYPLFN